MTCILLEDMPSPFGINAILDFFFALSHEICHTFSLVFVCLYYLQASVVFVCIICRRLLLLYLLIMTWVWHDNLKIPGSGIILSAVVLSLSCWSREGRAAVGRQYWSKSKAPLTLPCEKRTTSTPHTLVQWAANQMPLPTGHVIGWPAAEGRTARPQPAPWPDRAGFCAALSTGHSHDKP